MSENGIQWLEKTRTRTPRVTYDLSIVKGKTRDCLYITFRNDSASFFGTYYIQIGVSDDMNLLYFIGSDDGKGWLLKRDGKNFNFIIADKQMVITLSRFIGHYNFQTDESGRLYIDRRKLKESDVETKPINSEAVAKQIPMTPNLFGDGYSDGELVYDSWECPRCGATYEIEYDEYDYCPKCGQRIKWDRREKADE